MTYQEQLQDPRWQAKRSMVLNRDGNKCRRCETPGRLNVHHIRYHPGKMAWEYTHYDLITLCERCHAKEHGIEMPPQGASIGEWINYYYGGGNKKKDG